MATELRAGRRLDVPGVGETITERLSELVATGHMAYLEALRDEVPPSLLPLLAIPGVGPRTLGTAWRELGIATADDFEAAAREGRLRTLPGFGARTEARILAGIQEAIAAARAPHAHRGSAGPRRTGHRDRRGDARRAVRDRLRFGASA